MKPISPERWRDKFSDQPGDSSLTPAPAGVRETIAALQRGEITVVEAAARLEAIGLPSRTAAEMARLNASQPQTPDPRP